MVCACSPICGGAVAPLREARRFLLACTRSTIVFVSCAWLSTAVALPDSFVPTDDSVGPTCAYYLGMGNLPWGRPGGDWADAADQPYGSRPFDAKPVPPGSGRQVVEFDVTAIVRGWLAGRHRNAGLLLRSLTAGNGIVALHSREAADPTLHPSLKLEWADGTSSRLAPSADTHLDCSSLTSLGAQRQLLVGAQLSTLLVFPTPSKPEASLARAVLNVVSDQQYGSGATVGVFRADLPYARRPAPIEWGIARAYPLDLHLSEHPAVLKATGFEGRFWFTDWLGVGWLRSAAQTLQQDPERKFESLSGQALRVTLKRGANLGLDLSYYFKAETGQEPEEIYFRYYLRFANDWNPSLDGGKLPGLAGTYGQAGWGMRKTDGYNGWSLRGEFAARPAGAPSVAGLTTIGSYAYHADIEDAAGESWPWGEGPAAVLQNNRWYCIEQYVRLNTPGQKDGVLRAWVDGRRVLQKSGIRFRHLRELKIERVWLNVYHGGIAPAPHDMSLYIDNLVIARQYIGPVGR